ncbi:purine-cytosine permease family protein [Kitasatospora kifunensis]|uniref:Purine-cytosine permease-like protein n=1 Tax=Kitasatospora kifunensis TaxID=58351 RepID=A0A7W7VXS6_KITKI|nr:cytosine permease [Kitasatospora kifunensis]MBB4926278.1 purine-cytosine permease-like protein [Kitasatospora kifunensis]
MPRLTPRFAPRARPPSSERRSMFERHSIDHVPADERHGTVRQQGPFWFLGNFQPCTVALGFIGPALGLSVGWTVLAGLLGIALGTVFMAVHAGQGPRLGLPQLVQSRAQFGYRGVVLVLAGALLTFVGFNVVNLLIVDAGLHGLFGWSTTGGALAATLAATALAAWGHDWLHRAFRLLFWLSLPLWLLLSAGLLAGWAGPAAPDPGGFTAAAFAAQFTAAAGYNLTFVPYVSDYSRYLPHTTRATQLARHVFWGAAASPCWLIPIGAWLAARLGSTDPLLGLAEAGNRVTAHLGSALAPLTLLALVAVMGLNAYSGMLTLLTAADSLRIRPARPGRPTHPGCPTQPGRPAHPEPVRGPVARLLALGALALAWSALALGPTAQVSATLDDAVLLMLYLLAPWSAINLVDDLLVRRGRYAVTQLSRPDGLYGNWAWRGILAYCCALAACFPFATLSFFTGPAARALGGVDLAFVVGLTVAGTLYRVFARSLDLAAEAPVVAASERELALQELALSS